MVIGTVLIILLSSICSSKASGLEHGIIRQLITKWAPLIWLAPQENYYPSNVEIFLKNAQLADESLQPVPFLPNELSNSFYLITNENTSSSRSFLNGINPKSFTPPTYVFVNPCTSNNSFRPDNLDFWNIYNNTFLRNQSPARPSFTATYWTFYPYNEGKKICFIGKVPAFSLFGRCFGHKKTIGNHVGDWEHMTLSFKGKDYPSDLYIAIHNTGSYYKYDPKNRIFKIKLQNKKLLRPKFPPVVRLQMGHPVLFAANGSHGLWGAPGDHDYVKLPRLTDICGYGAPWKTWENLEIFQDTLPQWAYYSGRWGNPKSNCVFSKKLGLCEFSDGPQGPIRENQDLTC